MTANTTMKKPTRNGSTTKLIDSDFHYAVKMMAETIDGLNRRISTRGILQRLDTHHRTVAVGDCIALDVVSCHQRQA